MNHSVATLHWPFSMLRPALCIMVHPSIHCQMVPINRNQHKHAGRITAQGSQSLTRSLPNVRFHCTLLESPMAGNGGAAWLPSGSTAPFIQAATSSLMR